MRDGDKRKITGTKVAWLGLGILFGGTYFMSGVQVFGAIALIVGVVMILFDK